MIPTPDTLPAKSPSAGAPAATPARPTPRLMSVLVAILGVLLTVLAVLALAAVSVRISNITDPVWRHVAISGELVGGVFWLLGAVYVATHLAVIIFAKPAPEHPPK